MLRIIRSADYLTRPWKNGGGTTRDIASSPPGASLDDFVWRLSLAQVDRDGPFSRFDNVDRTLVLLSGAMTLHEQDRRIDLIVINRSCSRASARSRRQLPVVRRSTSTS